MKLQSILYGLLLIVGLVSSSFAQSKTDNPKPPVSPPTETKPEEKPKEELDVIPVQDSGSTKIESVFVIINGDNVSQLLVVGNNGEWLVDVKEIKVHLTIDREAPKVECTIYRGIFKPSEFETKTWDISKITLAKKEEFQQVVDSLSKGKLPISAQ